MPSRRDVLRAGVVAGVAATGGCGALPDSGPAIEAWEPEPGSWPLPGYDPANTAHNPHATPPTAAVSPAHTWELDVDVRHLLVARGFVIGAGLDGIRMVRPPEHGRWWNDPVGASAVGVHDGTLYAATPAGADESGTRRGLLRGLDLDAWDEASLWTTFEMGSRHATQLLPTAAAAFVGYPSYADDRIPVFDPESGDRRGELSGYAVSVAGGTAYANRYEIAAYRLETGFLSEGFHREWETTPGPDWRIQGGPPVVDGIVLGGVEVEDRDVPGVRAIDADSGDERFTTPVPSLSGTSWTGAAVADDLAFVAGSEYRTPGRIAAVDLGGDGVRWRADLEHWYDSIAVGGGVVVVAGGVSGGNQGGPDAGQVTALDADSGEPNWSFRTEAPIAGVAPVEDAVYVGTESGTVHELRAT